MILGPLHLVTVHLLLVTKAFTYGLAEELRKAAHLMKSNKLEI